MLLLHYETFVIIIFVDLIQIDESAHFLLNFHLNIFHFINHIIKIPILQQQCSGLCKWFTYSQYNLKFKYTATFRYKSVHYMLELSLKTLELSPKYVYMYFLQLVTTFCFTEKELLKEFLKKLSLTRKLPKLSLIKLHNGLFNTCSASQRHR